MVRDLQPSTNIFQLNTHKSIISFSNLIDDNFKDNRNIALVQEPMLGIEGTRGVPFPLMCSQTTSIPRAVIIHNPSLDIWQIPHLSDSNFQTGIWRNTKHKMPIIIISAYWGIKLDNIPSTLKAAITEAKRKKYEILLGIDTNAHHPAWGSPGINQRGTLFENLITA
jgi:hypothetical protein